MVHTVSDKNAIPLYACPVVYDTTYRSANFAYTLHSLYEYLTALEKVRSVNPTVSASKVLLVADIRGLNKTDVTTRYYSEVEAVNKLISHKLSDLIDIYIVNDGYIPFNTERN